MFLATMCPSSGETTIFVTLGTCYTVWMTVWYAGCTIFVTLGTCYTVWMTVWYARCTLHTSHPYGITSTKCRKNSCFSWWWAYSCPKHVDKRNKYTKKNCSPSWLYLHNYTGTYSQQNVKNVVLTFCLLHTITSVDIHGSGNTHFLTSFTSWTHPMSENE